MAATNRLRNGVQMITIMCIVVASISNFKAQADVTCNHVKALLAPCLPFITKPNVPDPTKGCCDGVRTVNNTASSTPDRRATCKCLKECYTTIPGIILSKVQALPDKCHVKIPYKLDLSTDCNKIQ